MSRPTELGAVCGHGLLARSCAYCDYEEYIVELKAQLAEAHARIGRLRELIKAWERVEAESLTNDNRLLPYRLLKEAAQVCNAHNDLTPPTAEGASDV